jgi:hypothetical protein
LHLKGKSHILDVPIVFAPSFEYNIIFDMHSLEPQSQGSSAVSERFLTKTIERLRGKAGVCELGPEGDTGCEEGFRKIANVELPCDRLLTIASTLNWVVGSLLDKV